MRFAERFAAFRCLRISEMIDKAKRSVKVETATGEDLDKMAAFPSFDSTWTEDEVRERRAYLLRKSVEDTFAGNPDNPYKPMFEEYFEIFISKFIKKGRNP